MRTLIVEDNPINCQLMKRYLEPCGPCAVATDGLAGVEAFRDALAQGEPFELVCLDVMMPQLDGHEALAAIRDLEHDFAIAPEKRARILMASAVDAQAAIDSARESGADGYLVKPIRKLQLYEELDRLGLAVPAPERPAS